ncbi:MAG: hypothetical protein ACJAYU_001624 [Bradymonadia bacterium]|jgi:hypothetical protein
MKRFLLLAGLAGGLVISAACDDGVESSSSLDDLLVPLAPAVSQNLCQTTSRVPSSKAGEALLWTLDALNLFPSYATDDAVLENFDASVFDGVSASAIAASLRDVGSERPFALAGFTEVPGATRVSAVLASARSGYIEVTLETTNAGKLTVLHFAPYEAPASAPDCPDVVAPTPAAAAAPAAAAPLVTPPSAPPATPEPTSQPNGQ